MNPDRNGHLSRRTALGLAAAAGMGGAVLARGQAWAAPAKLAKETVKYVEVSADKGKDCDDCAQFHYRRVGERAGVVQDRRRRDQPPRPLHRVFAEAQALNAR